MSHSSPRPMMTRRWLRANSEPGSGPTSSINLSDCVETLSRGKPRNRLNAIAPALLGALVLDDEAVVTELHQVAVTEGGPPPTRCPLT